MLIKFCSASTLSRLGKLKSSNLVKGLFSTVNLAREFKFSSFKVLKKLFEASKPSKFVNPLMPTKDLISRSDKSSVVTCSASEV